VTRKATRAKVKCGDVIVNVDTRRFRTAKVKTLLGDAGKVQMKLRLDAHDQSA
jgi:GDP-D-mannose dehydratase